MVPIWVHILISDAILEHDREEVKWVEMRQRLGCALVIQA